MIVFFAQMVLFNVNEKPHQEKFLVGFLVGNYFISYQY